MQSKFKLSMWAATLATTLLMGCGSSGGGSGVSNPQSIAMPVTPEPATITIAKNADGKLWDASFDTLQKQTFQFFWDTADKGTGLIPDRWPNNAPTELFSSIAANGWGLAVLGVGAERGFVTRDAAAERALKMLRTLKNAPQCDKDQGCSGYKGFFYRYLNMQTGVRTANVELSSVDTSELMMGVLFAGQYFNQNNAVENEIRASAKFLYDRVEWDWMQPNKPAISHGWMPVSAKSNPTDLITSHFSTQGADGKINGNFLKLDWVGYNEASMLYPMALGSDTHPAKGDAWGAWTAGYDREWGKLYGQEHLTFRALFAHQFTQIFFDMRGIQDKFMKSKGIDYFENSRRAALAHQQYAIENPMNWKGYSKYTWGLSAVDGPASVKINYYGKERKIGTYSARGLELNYAEDDGTIAPTGMIAMMPFAPEIVAPSLKYWLDNYKWAMGEYGFFDAFNLSMGGQNLNLQHGKMIGDNWVDKDYLGLDQGPIVLMMENYRSELIWKAMRKQPNVIKGLKKAGFSGGWLK